MTQSHLNEEVKRERQNSKVFRIKYRKYFYDPRLWTIFLNQIHKHAKP